MKDFYRAWKRNRGLGGMAQVVECLSSKHEALNSNPSIMEGRKERKEEKERNRVRERKEGRKKEKK
jgi:hypothetical protein